MSGKTRAPHPLERAFARARALAALIREMTGCRLEVIGLSRHHERILRYLAEPLAASAGPSRDDRRKLLV